MPSSPAPPAVTSLTPVLAVDAIEPLLPFWTGRLGFQVTSEVPLGDALGFVILEKGPARLMLQTRASIQDDVEAVHTILEPGTPMLFIEVESIAEVVEALGGWDPILVPLRETWYGSREVIVQAPGGAVVAFAEFTS
jgi:hypothetical protein